MNHGPPQHGPESNVNNTDFTANDIGIGGLGSAHSAGPPIGTPTSIALGVLVLA